MREGGGLKVMRFVTKAKNIKVWLVAVQGLMLILLLSAAGQSDTVWSLTTSVHAAEGNVLWQLGEADDSAAEFRGTGAGTVPLSSKPAAGTNVRSVAAPPGLDRSGTAKFTVDFRLSKVPVNGAMLKVRILDAGKAIPQMAVFANGQLSGIVQIAGVGDTGSKYPFVKTYSLYIPKEQLQTGTNWITLESIRSLYGTVAEDAHLWWTWDYLALTALDAPADEPIHGSYIRTGTTLNNEQFYYDEAAVRHLPYVLKWLGIAYSGNIMRTGCGSDVAGSCSAIGEYYDVLKDYNTQAVSYHLHTGGLEADADGTLPDKAEKTLADYIRKYGSKFQYYEIDNEPGLFNRSKAVNIAIADWLNKNKAKLAPGLKTVAPGWAYWPGYAERECRNQRDGGPRQCGTPDGWERDPAQRLELEQRTDATNGHSYGESYADAKGGSFVENLLTFGGAKEGLPKPMINTEFGTSDDHVDNRKYGATEPKSAAFDRIMRAHIGYADMFIQHAAFFEGYSLFETGFNLEGHNPADTRIYYNEGNRDSRVGVMRRLSLAYATHGKPLEYTVLNQKETAGKLVYFRAVDTSKLAPLPVTGGTSDKLLLNFVNFSGKEETIRVRVKLPGKGMYAGERFGAGDSYKEARSTVSGLKATPYIELTEKLGPGEAVQYILSPVKKSAAKAPEWMIAEAEAGPAIRLNWLESEQAEAYDVLRAVGSKGVFEPIARQVQGTTYVDHTVKGDERYAYAVRVSGAEEISAATEISSGLYPLDRRRFKVTATNADQSNPRSALDGSPRTRWDTGVWQEPGQFYQIDLGETATVEQIVLDTSGSAYDYPRSYEVYLSTDGEEWGQAVYSGQGTEAITRIALKPVSTRHIRIVNTGRVGNFWSIHELQVYSPG